MNIVDKYRLISQIGYICAIVFMAIAIVLFFTLKINRVFGYITGLSKKKAIREMSEYSYQTNENLSGNITADTGRKHNITSKIAKMSITSEILTSKATQHNPIEETTVLSNNETTLLQNEETTILETGEQLPVEESNAVLNESVVSMTKIQENEFVIVKDIVFIHTDIVV